VKVTVIDLGLARMDGYEGEQRWTEFDPEIFEGEGDYQFDVYRMMKTHNGNEWATYQPLTNVMVRLQYSLLSSYCLTVGY
jgi:serine/threonine-protein kinase haspin